MDERTKHTIEEMTREEQAWKARNPEPVLHPWPFQDALTVLIASGFAREDDATAQSWKRRAWRDGKSSYHTSYVWTLEGKEACWRYEYTTPMAWADQMHSKRERHCIICGRDCYRKKVWASNGRVKCVCMVCGAQGHELVDRDERSVEYGAS